MDYRVAVRRLTGSAFVRVAITDANAVWSATPGLQPVKSVPQQPNDPGPFGLYLDCWRLGAQSAKIRILAIEPKAIEIHGDYGDGSPWELFLSITSPDTKAVLTVTAVGGQSGGRVQVRSQVDVNAFNLSGTTPNTFVLRLADALSPLGVPDAAVLPEAARPAD